jgi:uncharacterized protein YndB with AHSA1/START domain
MKKIFIAIPLALVLTIVAGFFMLKNFKVEDSILINSQRSTVFAHLKNISENQAWMKSENGFTFELDKPGNEAKKVIWKKGGDEAASLEVKSLVEDEKIEFDLHFKSPFESIVKVKYTLSDNGYSTLLVYSAEGDGGLKSRLISFLARKNFAKDLSLSLAELKKNLDYIPEPQGELKGEKFSTLNSNLGNLYQVKFVLAFKDEEHPESLNMVLNLSKLAKKSLFLITENGEIQPLEFDPNARQEVPGCGGRRYSYKVFAKGDRTKKLSGKIVLISSKNPADFLKFYTAKEVQSVSSEDELVKKMITALGSKYFVQGLDARYSTTLLYGRDYSFGNSYAKAKIGNCAINGSFFFDDAGSVSWAFNEIGCQNNDPKSFNQVKSPKGADYLSEIIGAISLKETTELKSEDWVIANFADSQGAGLRFVRVDQNNLDGASSTTDRYPSLTRCD